MAGDEGDLCFPGLLHIPGDSLAVPAFPVWAQTPCLAPGVALSPGPKTPCWEWGWGPEWGRGPLTLLIGFGTFCSDVWTLSCSGSGSLQAASR